MDARTLSSKLTYTGMEQDIRKLALKNNLARAEEIAIMSELDVCELILKHFVVIYAEAEELGLVHKNDFEAVSEKIHKICR